MRVASLALKLGQLVRSVPLIAREQGRSERKRISLLIARLTSRACQGKICSRRFPVHPNPNQHMGRSREAWWHSAVAFKCRHLLTTAPSSSTARTSCHVVLLFIYFFHFSSFFSCMRPTGLFQKKVAGRLFPTVNFKSAS